MWRRRKRSEAEIGTAKQVLSVLVREKCIRVRKITIVPPDDCGKRPENVHTRSQLLATDGATLSVVPKTAHHAADDVNVCTASVWRNPLCVTPFPPITRTLCVTTLGKQTCTTTLGKAATYRWATQWTHLILYIDLHMKTLSTHTVNTVTYAPVK